MDTAIVFEKGEKVYIVGPVAPIQPRPNELEEFAFADVVRSQAPNELLLWLRGQYVEGDVPNKNGQLWSSEELAIKSITPRLMPVSLMHNPRHTVGLIADTKLLTPEADSVPRSRIDTALALWKHRYPEVCEEAIHNYERGTLMQSMECVPLDTEILTRRGFKRYDELRPTDETVGYNPETERNEWTPIKAVVRKRSPLVSLGNRKWRVRCTEGHRWLAAYGRRRGTKFVFGERRMVDARDLGHRDQLVLSAPASLSHPDGALQITPAEAGLVGWVIGDGTYRQKGSTFTMSISQSKPDGVMALELALAAAQMDYTVSVRGRTRARRNDGATITQRYDMHTYRLPAARARDLWYRAELDHLSWTGFVLRLSDACRSAWLEAIYQAEGNENHGRCISQQPGPVKDAIALAAYLEGYRPTSHEVGDPGDNSQAASHVRLVRRPINGESLSMIALGDAEVWCPVTGLGTWTMRQDDQVLLTGNCLPGYYSCVECGKSFVKMPHGAESANWCEHMRAGAVETAAAATTRAPRRLGDVTFTGTGLIFGSYGAIGAFDKAHLDTFAEEVAEFHERAHEKPQRRQRRMETIEIPRSEYDDFRAQASKIEELTRTITGLEETAAKVGDLQKSNDQLEVEKKKAEDDLKEERTKREGLEETARAATLSSERISKIGEPFKAKLPDSIKARLEEQAQSLSDDDWNARLEELAELVGVKPDEKGNGESAASGNGSAATFSREETARANLGSSGASQEPSRTAVSTVLGGLFENTRPKRPEPAKK